MGTKNHSEVVKGSRHAPHNLEYTNSANREAGTNEASGITLTAANVYQIARQTDNETFWMLMDHSPIEWAQVFIGRDTTNIDADDGLTIFQNKGGLAHYCVDTITIDDDETFSLPTGSYGFGRFLAGDGLATGTNVEVLHICWAGNGSVQDLGSTTNTALTDSDTDWCAFDGGVSVTIKNRLGSSKVCIFEYTYYLGIVV